MNALSGSVFVDEDVDVLVVDLLRGQGFIALTVRDAGRPGRSDAEQLAFAAEQGMALLTHDRDDYVALHVQYLTEGKHHWGIFITTRRPLSLLLDNLLDLLNSLTAKEPRGQLLYV